MKCWLGSSHLSPNWHTDLKLVEPLSHLFHQCHVKKMFEVEMTIDCMETELNIVVMNPPFSRSNTVE